MAGTQGVTRIRPRAVINNPATSCAAICLPTEQTGLFPDQRSSSMMLRSNTGRGGDGQSHRRFGYLRLLDANHDVVYRRTERRDRVRIATPHVVKAKEELTEVAAGMALPKGGFTGRCGTNRARRRDGRQRRRLARQVRGFSVRQTDWQRREPLNVADAWLDTDGAGGNDGNDITLLLNRAPEAGVDLSVGYGFGVNPPCDLTDVADMRLCAFSWRSVSH